MSADIVPIDRGEPGVMGTLRSLVTDLSSRAILATKAGLSFGGKRDLYQTLGYPEKITLEQYRSMFERNGIAERVVAAMAEATWRGGGEVIEDGSSESRQEMTKFEKDFDMLNKRLKIWTTFKRGDILAGLGSFAVVVIGAVGKADTPLPKGGIDNILYLTVRAEDEVDIDTYEENPADPRFGKPLIYTLKRASANVKSSVAIKVHWTRIIHIADGLLDDEVMGAPRLRKTYNWCQDLEKVAGGGAEAFWIRANQGLQLDIDPEARIAPGSAEENDLKNEVDEYIHKIRRVLRTRGVKAKTLGSDVADFSAPVQALVSLISGSSQIPQRILLGSERGELASSQDRFNWDSRIRDRRLEYAGPFIVRQFVDRCQSVGYLPMVEYSIRWPEVKNLDDMEKGKLAESYARVNQTQGETVVTNDEIRERALELPPMTAEQKAEIEEEKKKKIAAMPPAMQRNIPGGQGNGREDPPPNPQEAVGE